MPNKICAIVPIYNREELLIECLEALTKQTRPLDGIYLIDNASTDNIPHLLLEKGYIQELPPPNLKYPIEKEYYIKNLFDHEIIAIHYVRMEKNTGAAGGFYEGIKRAFAKKYDWLWLLDQDAIADLNALAILLNNIEHLIKLGKVGYICSNPLNMDGKPDLMLLPRVVVKDEDKALTFNSYYTKEVSVLPISSCGFTGALVSSLAIKECGFPFKEFFIWNEDFEWTRRIFRQGFLGFISLDSRITHFTLNTGPGDNIDKMPLDKLERIYFEVRNKAVIFRQDYKLIKFIIIYLLFVLKVIKRLFKRKDINKTKYLLLIIKAFINGFLFKPKIEKP